MLRDGLTGTLPRTSLLDVEFVLTEGVEMDIWEPCNYVSNLAYDRLLVEMCVQQAWDATFLLSHFVICVQDA